MKNVVLLLISLFFILVLHSEECPFGLTNDPYPGKCGRYADEDGNDICDLSEISSEDTISADLKNTDDSLTDETSKFEESNEKEGNGNRHGKNNEENRENKEEETLSSSEDENSADSGLTSDKESGNSESANKSIKTLFGKKNKSKSNSFRDKYFLFILIPLFVFAVLLSYFSKKKMVPVLICDINRWVNLLIFASFIVTAITSIMLVLTEYKLIKAQFLSNLVFIHNFTGIIFILLSILHIYLKWQFYVTFFKCYILKDKK